MEYWNIPIFLKVEFQNYIKVSPMAGIYIHIPFCKRKCHYCNFFSSASVKQKDDLLEALLMEIRMQKDYLGKEVVKTIYIGGGTPSLLNSEDIFKIYNEIKKYYILDEHIEFTLEANPDDLSPEKLLRIKDTPVNRLCIGVQSFHDDDLKYLGRIHDAKQSLKALQYTINAGFYNISADLIFGIPGQDIERWRNNLNILVKMNIPHISAYSLTVEPGTILERRILQDKIIPPDETLSVRHFNKMMKIMKDNNYIHYEISNFCRHSFISEHNNNYWFGEKYLGIGPSAHSFNGNQRQWNVSNISVYIEQIKNKIIPSKKETLSAKQMFNEYLMIRLRTILGCDLKYIEKKFGADLYLHCIKQSKQYLDTDHLRMDDQRLYLTDTGKLFADKIASDMFFME